MKYNFPFFFHLCQFSEETTNLLNEYDSPLTVYNGFLNSVGIVKDRLYIEIFADIYIFNRNLMTMLAMIA